LGFSGAGTFSSTMVKRPERPETRMVWVFSSSAGSAMTFSQGLAGEPPTGSATLQNLAIAAA
jgi:hypothetical protein